MCSDADQVRSRGFHHDFLDLIHQFFDCPKNKSARRITTAIRALEIVRAAGAFQRTAVSAEPPLVRRALASAVPTLRWIALQFRARLLHDPRLPVQQLAQGRQAAAAAVATAAAEVEEADLRRG